MEATTDRPALLADSRRTFRLLHPAVQLRLAVHVLLVSLGFGLLLAWNVYFVYSDLVEMVLASAPASLERQLDEQSLSFALVSTLMLVAYICVVLGICVAYTHRLLGPTVALRRQIHALKNGNCRGRVQLRKTDGPFFQLADEVNELTQVLSHVRNGDDPRSY